MGDSGIPTGSSRFSSDAEIIRHGFQSEVQAVDRVDRRVGSRWRHLGRALLALPFVMIGGLLVLWGQGWIDRPNGYNVPDAVALAIGLFFGSVGCVVFIQQLFKTLFWKAQRQFAGLPWAECHWDQTQVVAGRRPMAVLSTGVFWVGLSSLFAVPVLSSDAGGMSVFGLVLLLLPAGVAAVTVYLVGRALKYGRSRLCFRRFPFFIGEDLAVELVCDRGIRDIRRLTARVRCIERYEVWERSGSDRQKRVCFDALYDVEVVVASDARLAPGEHLPIVFALPGDALPSDLRTTRPRWWELIVHADTPGVDFEQSFHLPVYNRPAP